MYTSCKVVGPNLKIAAWLREQSQCQPPPVGRQLWVARIFRRAQHTELLTLAVVPIKSSLELDRYGGIDQRSCLRNGEISKIDGRQHRNPCGHRNSLAADLHSLDIKRLRHQYISAHEQQIARLGVYPVRRTVGA